jgi:hypothetical protein
VLGGGHSLWDVSLAIGNRGFGVGRPLLVHAGAERLSGAEGSRLARCRYAAGSAGDAGQHAVGMPNCAAARGWETTAGRGVHAISVGWRSGRVSRQKNEGKRACVCEPADGVRCEECTGSKGGDHLIQEGCDAAGRPKECEAPAGGGKTRSGCGVQQRRGKGAR